MEGRFCNCFAQCVLFVVHLTLLVAFNCYSLIKQGAPVMMRLIVLLIFCTVLKLVVVFFLSRFTITVNNDYKLC